MTFLNIFYPKNCCNHQSTLEKCLQMIQTDLSNSADYDQTDLIHREAYRIYYRRKQFSFQA